MLTDIILAVDGKKPEKIASLDDLFNYKGKKKLKKIKSFQAIADTTEMSLAYFGDMFPLIQRLHLNNSIIPSIRDLRSNLPKLSVLHLAHCGLSSLDGITTIAANLVELYLAFNQIEDVSELLGMNSLKILDLEGNLIPYVENVEILKCCRRLRNLTLRGNGCEENPDYRKEIKRLLPRLVYLDEIKFGEEEKVEEPPAELPHKEEEEKKEDVVINPPEAPNVEMPDMNVEIDFGETDREKLPPLKSAQEVYRDKTIVTDMVRDKVDKRPPTSGHAGQFKRVRNTNQQRAVKKPAIVKNRRPHWYNYGPIRL